ncbi:MAG: cytochrome c-type biogenesis protein CcmH [Acidobacteriota bacterium]
MTHGPVGARFAIVIVALALLSAAPPVEAQVPSAKQQAADLAGQLMSPFCPGFLLADCTSPNAFALRDDIARRIAAGESAADVKADLVRQYGAEILGAPRAEGWGWLAWVVPAVLGLASLAGVLLKVAHAVRAPQPVVAAAGAADARILARLDDELRDLD